MIHLISWTFFLQKGKNRLIPVVEIRERFRKFAISLVNGGIFLFTNGSRKDEEDEDSAVDAAVYSSDLKLAIKSKPKLPAETSIFSAEA